MKDRFYILDNYLTFGVPYFLYDLVSMYAVHSTQDKDAVTVSPAEILQFLRDRPLIVFHHLLVPILALLLAFRKGGDCLIGSFLMIEASTPFVSARVILVHLNMKVIELATNLREVSQSRRTPLLASRVFSWLKVPTSAFTFKNLLRHLC